MTSELLTGLRLIPILFTEVGDQKFGYISSGFRFGFSLNRIHEFLSDRVGASDNFQNGFLEQMMQSGAWDCQ